MTAQREWFEKDYYKVLGVSDTATQKEITRAYRKLARENHPDAKPGDTAAEERFKEISAAYDVVGDADKRKEYDEVRRLGPDGRLRWSDGWRLARRRLRSGWVLVHHRGLRRWWRLRRHPRQPVRPRARRRAVPWHRARSGGPTSKPS